MFPPQDPVCWQMNFLHLRSLRSQFTELLPVLALQTAWSYFCASFVRHHWCGMCVCGHTPSHMDRQHQPKRDSRQLELHLLSPVLYRPMGQWPCSRSFLILLKNNFYLRKRSCAVQAGSALWRPSRWKSWIMKCCVDVEDTQNYLVSEVSERWILENWPECNHWR